MTGFGFKPAWGRLSQAQLDEKFVISRFACPFCELQIRSSSLLTRAKLDPPLFARKVLLLWMLCGFSLFGVVILGLSLPWHALFCCWRRESEGFG